ncbi:SpoIID/LytB domain-containing protein [Alicyclobacillus fastidiosus]|uniref:SpoIID/LytB domain-containing protein n=1 Tax=Alicyclobacillus fastidiosus TaxID=392011 RepID=A0ABY6ZI83_9BACL|nr:SpoIID/LytB domain-containing protein [Alicyclobacillus fastidiosus]WAH41831.1 SpoIID/LytB domain-containing protein [Alicyclobacillus fastidiosus]GMA63530.1 stage II sporulation protein D [Alicyclobacillus fastidiosus]
MTQRRFVPAKSTSNPAKGRAFRGGPPPNQSDLAVAPSEVLRFVLRIALIFFAIVGLPTIVARSVHRGPMPDVTAWLHTSDAKRQVRVYSTETESTTTMALNNYVLGVLAAEFSPGAPIASLKAAAVATRTYAIHAMTQMGGPPSVANQHGADVTDDASLDLPIASESDVEAEYPNQSLQFLSQLQAAVEATDGQIIVYQKKPILAFMFEESPGRTRSSVDALHQSIPYLPAISCPDDAVDPDRISTNTFDSRELGQAFGQASVNLAQLKLTRATDGFVTSVKAGDQTITGADFAARLSLPSTDFTWLVSKGGLTITSYGRGLDVGMSLHEAQALAAKMDWQDILSHFYPDTSVQSDGEFL